MQLTQLNSTLATIFTCQSTSGNANFDSDFTDSDANVDAHADEEYG